MIEPVPVVSVAIQCDNTLTVFKHCQEHLKLKWRVERMHIEPYTIHDESEQFFLARIYDFFRVR